MRNTSSDCKLGVTLPLPKRHPFRYPLFFLLRVIGILLDQERNIINASSHYSLDRLNLGILSLRQSRAVISPLNIILAYLIIPFEPVRQGRLPSSGGRTGTITHLPDYRRRLGQLHITSKRRGESLTLGCILLRGR